VLHRLGLSTILPGPPTTFSTVIDAGPTRWHHRVGFAILGTIFRFGYLVGLDPRMSLLLALGLHALWNNVLWIVFYTSLVVFLGLVIAVIALRVRYEAIVKAIVFLPMAIAATALAVIWKFVYSPDADLGVLNAILGTVGVGPIPWLGSPEVVNGALIAAGVWGSVGFATVILSAALKGIPAEIIEAARVEGASERQIFFRIIVPMVSLPMSVLAVTLIVNVIKLFDLIFVMTQGGPGKASRVIAFTMWQQAFEAGQFGFGSAVAVVMLLLLVPIMAFNVRHFRAQAVT
jgi:alpha-glucoside transport system permease protein